MVLSALNSPRQPPGSLLTPRWSEGDSNCRSLSRECRLIFAEEKAFRLIRVVKTGDPFSRGTSGSNLFCSGSEPGSPVNSAAADGKAGVAATRSAAVPGSCQGHDLYPGVAVCELSSSPRSKFGADLRKDLPRDLLRLYLGHARPKPRVIEDSQQEHLRFRPSIPLIGGVDILAK